MKQPKYCTIYLVRHGETTDNVAGLIGGHTNAPLTDNGFVQAQNIAQKLKSIKFTAAFSSDLIRAHKTAEVIAAEHKLVVNTSQLLRERRFGSLEGRMWEEVRQELKHRYSEKEELSTPERLKYRMVPDAENDEEMNGRLLTFLREIAIAYPEKNILVVAHGGVLRHLLTEFGYGSYKQLMNAKVENTAYSIIRSDGVDFFVDDIYGITFPPDH